MKRLDDEAVTFFGRANYRGSAGARGRRQGRRSLPQARDFLALNRHEAHSWPRHCFATGCGVDRVVLTPFDVRFGVRRRHQKYLMTHRLKFSRPIMRRTTRLHAHEAGFDPRKEFAHLQSRQLARYRRTTFALQRMDLKIILGQIDANSDKLFHGRSPSLWRFCDHALALDAVEERSPRQWFTKASIRAVSNTSATCLCMDIEGPIASSRNRKSSA